MQPFTQLTGLVAPLDRVNVDTGAFRSGVLSALVVEGDDKQILRVSGWGGLG